MDINLQEQYRQVETTIAEYRRFLRKALWRSINPLTFVRFMILSTKVHTRRKKDASPNDRFLVLTKRMTEIVYSSEERKDPFYEIGLGPDSLHRFSCFLESKHPDISFENLLTMHEISDLQIKAANPAKLFGFALAGGSLFLKTVPQVVVESFDIDYTQYQITTFWFLVAALAYIAIAVALWYTSEYRRIQVSKLAKEVIEYTAARIKAETPAGGETRGR
jgi:hypothetical protein